VYLYAVSSVFNGPLFFFFSSPSLTFNSNAINHCSVVVVRIIVRNVYFPLNGVLKLYYYFPLEVYPPLRCVIVCVYLY